MRHSLILACFLAFSSITPVLADPLTDATYIVEQQYIAKKADEEFALLAQNNVANIAAGIEKIGGKIIDPDRFATVLLGDFHNVLKQKVRQASIIGFQEFLTPAELAFLADFYRSADGQTLLAKGVTEETLEQATAFYKGGAGAPILQNLPELKARLDALIRDEAIDPIEEMVSLSRIAGILEMKDIIHFEDENRRKGLADGLRQAELAQASGE